MDRERPDEPWSDGDNAPQWAKIAEWEAERADEAEAEIARLRALVHECLDVIEQVPDDIQFWADYASNYFQAKHKLAGFIARYTDFLAKHRPEAQEERG